MIVPFRHASMDRLSSCTDLQAQKTAVTDANDIARIRIDRSAGLQGTRIKQVAYSQRAAGARFLVHNSRKYRLLVNRVDQFEISQKGKCVKTASDARLVIRRSASDQAS